MLSSLNRKLFAVAVLFALGAMASVSRAGVQWISTTVDQPWKEQPAPAVSTDASAAPDIQVHRDALGQEVDGFGGCFNELGWKALSGLPPEARAEALKSLFSDDGCAFTMARTPIGASDFALSAYSLDDTPGDLELKHFSIDRDRACQIQYIKAAMEVRPKLKVWASAWSPPAWMKDNNHYSGGHIKTDPDTLKAYANYLAKFVEEYRAAGIDLYAVAVQNEPRIQNNYPTCIWPGTVMRDFVRDHMGPTFRERKVQADIWLGTINDGNYNATVGTVMADAGAKDFMKAITFQWDGQNIIADAHRLFPDMRLVQSENECHNGKNSVADAEHTFRLFRKYMNGGANSYFFWNMVLQPGGKSTWGWAQNAMITADPDTGKVTYLPEFYVMKHVSHFVPPGSRLAYTTGTWGDRIAFVRPDGAAVVIVGNSQDKALPASLNAGGDTYAVTLPPRSFNTFVMPATGN